MTNVGTPITDISSYSYVAAIIDSNSANNAFCGGALIAPRLVLTSATCLASFTTPQVVLGCSNLQNLDNCDIIDVQNQWIHPLFDTIEGSEGGNDLAMLYLTESALTQTPIRIAEPGINLEYDECLEFNYHSTGQLVKQENSIVLDLESCDWQPDPEYVPGEGYIYFDPAPLDETMVCTHEDVYTGFACETMRGSPVVISGENADLLFGLFSFPIFCEFGEDGSTAVYASTFDTSNFDFILTQASQTAQALTVCSSIENCRQVVPETLSPTSSPTDFVSKTTTAPVTQNAAESESSDKVEGLGQALLSFVMLFAALVVVMALILVGKRGFK